jgi:hypothetical protein
MSRPALRASVAISIAAVLTIQVLVWCTVAGRQYREAITSIDANRGMTMQATFTPTGEQLLAVAKHLAPQSVLLAVEQPGDVVVATCAVAEAVIGDCARNTLGQPKVPQITLWADSSAKLVMVESVADYSKYEQATLLVVSTTSGLDHNLVARAFNDQIATPIGLEWPAGGDAVGGVIAKDQGRWFYAGGCWTLLTVLTMGAFSLAIELNRLARRFAALGLLVDRRSTFAAIALGSGGLPLLTSGITGLLVGALMVYTPTHLPGTGASLSARALLLMTVLTVLATVVVSLRCWFGITAASSGSQPTRPR